METTATTEKKNTPITAQTTDTTKETDKKSSETTQSSVSSEFSSFIQKALGKSAGTQVNEEELFAALIEQKLSEVGDEAAEFYRAEKEKLMVSMARADGYVNVEDVAKAALKKTVTDGKVDLAIAEKINGEAFAGAQLDDNLEMLYDSRGSGDDPTIAVSDMEAALLSMRVTIEKIESGEMSVAARSLDIPSNSVPGGTTPVSGTPADPASAPSGAQQLDGAEGFLWKPESESDGKLVVLLPTTLKGLIERVEVHSELPPTDTSKLGSGRFTGDTHNGGRPHYRFEKEGGEYGDNVELVVYKTDGSTATWSISDGAARND